MRVIAGEFRSRPLVAPRGLGTRPTSDRLRETLFNVLGPRVRRSLFADLYAGSGAVGIEALSRGATHCQFVEHATPALATLRKNLASLALTDRATVDVRPVSKVLAAGPKQQLAFDLVFLDPPYEAAGEYTATLNLLGDQHSNLLAPDALVIAEHARRDPLQSSYGSLQRTRLLEQGDAALSFFSVLGKEPADL